MTLPLLILLVAAIILLVYSYNLAADGRSSFEKQEALIGAAVVIVMILIGFLFGLWHANSGTIQWNLKQEQKEQVNEK